MDSWNDISYNIMVYNLEERGCLLMEQVEEEWSIWMWIGISFYYLLFMNRLYKILHTGTSLHYFQKPPLGNYLLFILFLSLIFCWVSNIKEQKEVEYYC